MSWHGTRGPPQQTSHHCPRPPQSRPPPAMGSAAHFVCVCVHACMRACVRVCGGACSPASARFPGLQSHTHSHYATSRQQQRAQQQLSTAGMPPPPPPLAPPAAAAPWHPMCDPPTNLPITCTLNLPPLKFTGCLSLRTVSAAGTYFSAAGSCAVAPQLTAEG